MGRGLKMPQGACPGTALWWAGPRRVVPGPRGGEWVYGCDAGGPRAADAEVAQPG